MARRDRVPRHKSHNQRKNKNPKLSPFQREQKRAKLANQAPTAKSMGTDKDIPKSERLVVEFLQKQRARQAEKRRLLLEQRQREAQEALQTKHQLKDGEREESDTDSAVSGENEGDGKEAAMCHAPRRQHANGDGSDDSDEEIEDVDSESEVEEEEETASPPPSKRAKREDVVAAAPTASAKQHKKAKGAFASIPSLNEELTSEMGKAVEAFRVRPVASSTATTASSETDPNRPRTVEEIIAKKKERKHKRKAEARRERVTEKYLALENEFNDLMKNGGGKKGKKGKAKGGVSAEEFNAAFEKKLKEMQAAKREEESHLKKLEKRQQQRGEGEDAEGKSSSAGGQKRRQRKSKHDCPNNGSGGGGEGQQSQQHNHQDALSLDHGERESTTTTSPSPSSSKKVISFAEDVAVASHHVMRFPGDHADSNSGGSSGGGAGKKRPRDFYELVDVVRYGERVDAPPVFDVVPNKSAAVTRLANKLAREEVMQASLRRTSGNGNGSKNSGPGLVGVRPVLSFGTSNSQTSNSRGKSRIDSTASSDERYRMLSSAGGIGEQKRLARLGLAPAITGPVSLKSNNSDHGGKGNQKQKEMELLRDRVMATYRQSKRQNVEKKKGVDMKHEFPQFS